MESPSTAGRGAFLTRFLDFFIFGGYHDNTAFRRIPAAAYTEEVPSWKKNDLWANTFAANGQRRG